MGTQAGEGSDDLTERNVVDTLGCLLTCLCQSLGGRVGSVLMLLIHRGRSDQEIYVNRRADEDSLAILARKLEDGR